MSHAIGTCRASGLGYVLGHVESGLGHHGPVRRPPGPAEVAARYGVHRAWVYKLKARYEAEGEAAFRPCSRRPKTSPGATPPETVELVLRLRKHLLEDGHDAGADTLGCHLAQHHAITLARATIYRILTLHGAVTPEPTKKPRGHRDYYDLGPEATDSLGVGEGFALASSLKIPVRTGWDGPSLDTRWTPIESHPGGSPTTQLLVPRVVS